MMAAVQNSSLTLTEIEGRGRALVAAQPLKGGEIILRDSPILIYSALPFTSANNNKYSYCSNCFRALSSSPPPLSCRTCSHDHLFCSPTCLSLAISSSHSPWICESLRRLKDCCRSSQALADQPLEFQVQARFLVAAYNLAVIAPSKFQLVLSLQGQHESSSSSSAQLLHSLVASVCPPPPVPIDGFSPELSATLLAKDKLNAFGLMEPFSEEDGGNRSVRAYGVYPMASFFNHDCLPNACRFDYLDNVDAAGPVSQSHNNNDIVVRMIHDVPQGREICLSYFPVNLRYSMRQKRLREDYGFTCLCDRCRVEVNWPENDDDDDDVLVDDQQDNMEGDDDEDEDEDENGSADANIVDGDQEIEEEEENDFPHAYFFVRYMCNRRNCWGTSAPLPPNGDGTSSSNVLECNVCGKLRKDEADDGDDGISMDE